MILRSWQLIAVSALVAGGLYLAWPRDPELAEVQLRSGSVEEGLRLLERERRVAPDDAGLRRRLERAYEQAGRPGAAVGLLEEEAARRPLSAEERERARRLALSIGEPGRALALLNRPDRAIALEELPALVDLALQAGEPATALRLQRRLATERPDPTTLARWRDLALGANDPAGAVAAQERLIALAPTRERRERLVELFVAAGDNARALAAFEALGPAPGAEAAYHRRAAELAEWAALTPRAVGHWRALYALAPDAALGRKLLAALVAANDPEAVAFAGRLSAAFPQDAALRRDHLTLLVAAGRIDEALAVAREGVARAPQDPAAHRTLLDLALGRSRHPEAIAELERWLAARPGDPETLHRLAQVQVWNRRVEDAWATYARLFEAAAELGAARARAWRTEWAALSGPLEDMTDSGRRNLRALLAWQPDNLIWRRRLARAANEVGERAEALAEQRRLVTTPGATRADALALVGWLFQYGQTAEGLGLLRRLDDQAPVPVDWLSEAAYQAARLERWPMAALFFGRAAERLPADVQAIVALARAHEAQRDWGAAVAAWRRRLALGGATATDRLHVVGLLLRLDRREDAFALLDGLGGRAALEEWRQLASLAFELKRPEAQARALAQVIARAPEDVPARLALAEIYDRAGETAQAASQFAQALALAPDDPAVLTRVAAWHLYGGREAEAGPLVERLAATPGVGTDAWRVLADYFRTRDPRRALRALDSLHAAGAGDAATQLLRGELALALGEPGGGREAFVRAVALASEHPDDPAQAEAGAAALERLERGPEAVMAYEAIARRFPSRLQPLLALARHHLGRRDPAAARPYLARAEALDGAAFETRLLRADWLAATDDWAAAAAAYARLRRERPALAFVAAAEASARFRLGEFRAARAVGRDALRLAPDDAGLRELHRGLRAEGAHRVQAIAELEDSPAVSRWVAGSAATWHASDRLRLGAEATRRDWAAAGAAEQLGLSADWRDGPWRARARADWARQALGVQSPLAEAEAGVVHPTWAARVGAAESRWEETTAAVARLGRERAAEADASYTPDPRVTLHANGRIGQLLLDGRPVGASRTWLGEVALRPAAQSPWTLYYQWRQREWGDAGPLVGLPLGVSVHSLLVGYADRWGPWRFELQPGYSQDAANGFGAPTVAGSLGLDLGPDAELTFGGALSGGNFLAGQAGGYRRVEAGLRWWF